MFTLIIADKNGAIVDEYSFEDGEFVLGRSQQADIVLPADNVSRRHARLFVQDGRCFIEDLGAANGVWMSGQRLTQPTEVPRSSQVRIGDFYLHMEGAAPQAPDSESIWGRLVPLRGSIGVLTELTQPTILVGRGKDCAVSLQDVSVSRIHAKISLQADGRVLVEDLRSSNGTFIGERRVEQAELRHGDRVRFGTVGFALQLAGQPMPDRISQVAQAVRAGPRQALLQAAHGNLGPAYAPTAAQPVDADAPFASRKGILQQVAAVVVIIVALVALVVLVVVAYDRLVAPKMAGPQVVAVPVPAAPAAAAVPAVGTELETESLDALLSKGHDAISRKQWDDAELLFKRARRLSIASPKVTEALNLITLERRAAARYAEAEAAFAKKDYPAAINYHRMIPSDSAYFPEAKLALQSMAQILEHDADKACEAKDVAQCKSLYQQAIATGYAGPQVEQKFAKALGK